MKKNDLNQPIGKLHVIPDFLPPPEDLFPKREAIKVTLMLDRESLDFFRDKAHEVGQKYQRMMRDVLREYSHLYRFHRPTKRSSGRPHHGRR